MRRNACIICSTSPQISESNAVLPASNTPTTVHCRPANDNCWPISTPANWRATELPTTISDEPARNMRPSMILTCGRSVLPISGRPRTTTLLRLVGSSIFGSEFSTTTSFDTSGWPSAPRATSGEVSISDAWSRNTPLCTSVWLPWRITTTLSGDPVDTSVAFSPASSISTAANTNTTSAMPPAVRPVVSLRTHRLRAM